MKEAFQLIWKSTLSDDECQTVRCYRDMELDTLYLKTYYTFAPMLDPTTGLPLTYKRYMELKQKK